jgi:predicted outer membrane repeat protein
VDFLDNRAARAGGAVALGTASNLVWSLPDNALSPDVSTVRFARNHADTGGAIAVDFRSTLGFLSESDTLLASLLSVAFYNNSATSAGGALFLLPVGESFLPSATFVGNRVTGQAGPLGGSYAGNGGCIYASSGSTFGFSGKPAVFSENSASGRGGSIFLESDVMFDDCDSFLATFSHNAAALAGGAVYYSDPVDRCNLSNANYAANIAPYGPDVASIDSELILVNTLPASFVPDHAASFIIPVKPGIPFSVNAVPLDRFGQQVLFSFTQYQLQIKDCPSTTSVVVNTNYQGRVEYADLRLTGHPGQLCSGQIALAQSLDGFQVSTNLTFVFDVCDAGYGFLNGECVACKPTVEFSVVPSASPCLKCPSSTVAQCTPTSLSWNEGFWFDRSKVQSPTSSSVQVYDCDPTVCLDGGVCGTYRKQDSLLCSECQQGYSEWNGQCIPCEEAHGGVLFGMLLVFWLFVIVQHFVGQTPTGATRILFTFVQMLSFVLYPSQLTNGIGLLSFDAVSPSSQQCPYPRDGYGVMFTSFATPFLMLLMLLVTCGLTLGIRSIIRKRTGRQVIMRGTSRTILLLRSLSSTESFVRTCVNMILFGFQTVASVSLAFVNCRQLDDTSVVATQPDIVCWDHSYRAWAPFYILSIIIAGVAPFVIGLWLMRSNRQRKRSSLPATQKFAFSSLTVLYRPSRYLWEAVDLLRRVVFIVLFTSFSTVPDLNVRRQLLLLAIAVSVALNWVLWPYRLKRDNVLSLVAWSTLMIIAILTGSDDSATRNITASRVLAWLCIVVLFCGILWRPLSRSIRWSRNRYGTQQHSRSAGSGSAMGHSAHELSGDLMLSSPDVGAEDGASGSYEPPSLTTSPNDI